MIMGNIPAVVFAVLLAVLNVFQFFVIVVLCIRQKGIKLEIEVASFVQAGWHTAASRARAVRNNRQSGRATPTPRTSMSTTDDSPNKTMAVLFTTSLPNKCEAPATETEKPKPKPKIAQKPQIIFTAYDLAAETGQEQETLSDDDSYQKLSDAFALEDGGSSDQNVAFQGEYDGVVSVKVNQKPKISPKPQVDQNRLQQIDEDVYDYPHHYENAY